MPKIYLGGIIVESTIRLFKAVPISKIREVGTEVTASKELLGHLRVTIPQGFVFAPEVIHNYSEAELLALAHRVSKEVGLSSKRANASFHKAWGKVRDASIEQLVIEQLIHYFTTYGYERLGIYDKDTVYIPTEELKIPKLREGIPLTVIRGYTKGELKEKLLYLLNQGVALDEDTVKDVVDVALFVEVSDEEVEGIRNKEARVILYDCLDKLPSNPTEFLRYVVYKATSKPLLIVNDETIEAIKAKQNVDVLKYFVKYRRRYGLERLAEIFYRFKPLFLAFRTNTQLRSTINRIRKLAPLHHKPMIPDYLNNVTTLIAKGKRVDDSELVDALSRVNTFRKIRLADALNFRTKERDSILYRIRNGKSYATGFTFNYRDEADRVLSIVLDSVMEDIRGNVEGKKIFIPENVVYALPATEKQFTGDFPSGSYVAIPKDMVFGVHWENVKGHRVDLDLSLLSAAGKMGWDARYRSEDSGILFSGDITDAGGPNGASELFYVSKQSSNPHSYIVFVNYFNYEEKVEVPFKIVVASEGVRDLKGNYMVNPNNVVAIAKGKITQKQKILGLVVTTPKENRFYFVEANIGNSVTSYGNDYTNKARKWLFDYYTSSISLNAALVQAGAKIVTAKGEGVDIDLSPERLEKDTIINLLSHTKPS